MVSYASRGDGKVIGPFRAFARNHPFVDGNKRSAAVVSETFFAINGHELGASDAEVVVAFVALAAGELSEEELADWLRGHLV